eukprot:Gb_38477 [translate_table: standard]
MIQTRQTMDRSMEIMLYSFEGSIKLHKWFQRLEKYFNYARFQHERDKTFTAMLHLTGQAYTWATQMCEYRGTDFPWNTLEELKEELELVEKWKSIKEKDVSNEETNKESEEDNKKDFGSDDYKNCHKEEDCIQDKQLDKGYEEYDEDPNEDSDEECDLEHGVNSYDKDVEEDHEGKDEKDQTEEDYPKLEPFDRPKKPEEHKDGEEDHIIHIDNGEMDQAENFCDEADYDPYSYDKHEDTIDEEVWDPSLIIPQTQHSGYHDFDEEDGDKNGDHNKDYIDLDKNPKEDPNPEVLSEEYYSDKNPDVCPNDEIGKQLKEKEDCSKDDDTKNR